MQGMLTGCCHQKGWGGSPGTSACSCWWSEGTCLCTDASAEFSLTQETAQKQEKWIWRKWPTAAAVYLSPQKKRKLTRGTSRFNMFVTCISMFTSTLERRPWLGLQAPLPCVLQASMNPCWGEEREVELCAATTLRPPSKHMLLVLVLTGRAEDVPLAFQLSHSGDPDQAAQVTSKLLSTKTYYFQNNICFSTQDELNCIHVCTYTCTHTHTHKMLFYKFSEVLFCIN